MANEVDDTKRLLGEFHQDKYLLNRKAQDCPEYCAYSQCLKNATSKILVMIYKGWIVVFFILSLLFPTILNYEFFLMENDIQKDDNWNCITPYNY